MYMKINSNQHVRGTELPFRIKIKSIESDMSVAGPPKFIHLPISNIDMSMNDAAAIIQKSKRERKGQPFNRQPSSFRDNVFSFEYIAQRKRGIVNPGGSSRRPYCLPRAMVYGRLMADIHADPDRYISGEEEKLKKDLASGGKESTARAMALMRAADIRVPDDPYESVTFSEQDIQPMLDAMGGAYRVALFTSTSLAKTNDPHHVYGTGEKTIIIAFDTEENHAYGVAKINSLLHKCYSYCMKCLKVCNKGHECGRPDPQTDVCPKCGMNMPANINNHKCFQHTCHICYVKFFNIHTACYVKANKICVQREWENEEEEKMYKLVEILDHQCYAVDFETITDKETNELWPILLVVRNIRNPDNTRYYSGRKWHEEFCEHVRGGMYTDSTMIAHNGMHAIQYTVYNHVYISQEVASIFSTYYVACWPESGCQRCSFKILD